MVLLSENGQRIEKACLSAFFLKYERAGVNKFTHKALLCQNA